MAALVASGKREEVDRLVREINERFREYPMSFLWYARAVYGDRLPEGVARMDLPALLEKLIILHSHIEHQLFRRDDAEIRKVARSIGTFIQAGNYEIIRDAFVAATETEGRNIANVLRINRSLPRDVRDKALANMLRTRPELAKLTGDAALAARPRRAGRSTRTRSTRPTTASTSCRRSTRPWSTSSFPRTRPRSARPPLTATSRRTPSGRLRSSARPTSRGSQKSSAPSFAARA